MGHAFGIFMAHVGALHSLRSFRRRLPLATRASPFVKTSALNQLPSAIDLRDTLQLHAQANTLLMTARKRTARLQTAFIAAHCCWP
ncbi:MAG: hypothetical protein KGI52_10815 [Burkholderiales bacterium]|nr:hypothetical protein [Burkholderiales bacterium]